MTAEDARSRDELEQFANAEARAQVQRLAGEQAALLRLATVVAEGVPPDEIFSAVSDEVAQLFGSSGLVLRFEEDGLGIVSVGVSAGNDIPTGARWEFEEGMASLEVYRAGRSARVDAFDWSSGSSPVADTAKRVGIVSSVSNPILVQNRLWGAITVFSTSGRLPDETEDRLEKFSQLVATALANAESREAVARTRDAFERVAAEQAALRRVATLVAQGVAPAEIFEAVSVEVDHLFGLPAETSDLAGVVRFDPGPEHLVVGVSKTLEAVRLGSRWEPHDLFAPTRVLYTGRSARVDAGDLAASEEEAAVAEYLRREGYLCQVASPIVVDGRLWGAISVNSKNDLPPDTEERLGRFTELVATAIANAESRGTMAQLADEQAALRRVATLVAKEDLPEKVFAKVAEETGRLFAGVECALVRNERDGAATSVGVWGEISAVFPLGTRFSPDGDGVVATVLRTGHPHRIDDYSAVADPIARSARDRGVESSVGCPIVVRGEIWGAIVVGTTGAEPFPPETELRLTQFADLVATAVANAEARGVTVRLADEQAALRRVATLVARDARPGEVFAAVAMEVGKLTDTDVTVVGRYDGDGSATAIGNWSASGGGVPVGTRSAIGGHNVLTLVAETGKPARVDGYDDASGDAAEIARRYGWRSSIAAPIVVEGRLWGVMLVATERPKPFPAGAEERLAAFTELVATAVANAQAHDELLRFVGDQAALGRVATLVAAGAAPEEVFTAVVAEVSSLLGLERIELVRYDGAVTGTVIASSGDHPFPAGTTWSLDDPSVMATVARTRRAARIDDYSDLEGEIARAAREAGFRSAIGAPITVEGRLWGVIIAISTDPEPIPDRSEARLGQFTELVATAVANAQARRDLVASRARIVAAGDEARRRIERDLHDGTQQRLVSLGLAVRATEANLPSGRQDLRDELSSVAMGLADAVEDLQEISRGIHPAILSRGGLGPALRTLAHRSAIPVDLEVATDVRFPESIEVAAYFVASEALANAAKHSEASRIEVSLGQRDAKLVLSIRDDGVGGANAASGSGIIGLTDRVEALGGSIRIESRPGEGTQIRAELLLGPEVPQPGGRHDGR